MLDAVRSVLGSIIPSLAVAVRRLHDTGRSGWWLLLGLVPFGGLLPLVFYLLPGTPGGNRYGPRSFPPGPCVYLLELSACEREREPEPVDRMVAE